MEHQQPVAEHGLDALPELLGDGDFRNKIEHVAALRQLFSSQMQIDFGLTASSRSMQQDGLVRAKAFPNLAEGFLLAVGEGIEDDLMGRRNFVFRALLFFFRGQLQLLLQTGIVGGFEDFAGRTKIIVGDRVPERQLRF